MRLSTKPSTTLGKWSVGLIIAFFLFLVLFMILDALGLRDDDTFSGNLTLLIIGLLGVVCGVSGLVTGIIGIVKNKERSILVFLAVAIGFLILILVLAANLIPST